MNVGGVAQQPHVQSRITRSAAAGALERPTRA